jgi:hypothetical protein
MGLAREREREITGYVIHVESTAFEMVLCCIYMQPYELLYDYQ